MDVCVENYISFLNDCDGFDIAEEGIMDKIKKVPILGKILEVVSNLLKALVKAITTLIEKITKKAPAPQDSTEKSSAVSEKVRVHRRDGSYVEMSRAEFEKMEAEDNKKIQENISRIRKNEASTKSRTTRYADVGRDLANQRKIIDSSNERIAEKDKRIAELEKEIKHTNEFYQKLSRSQEETTEEVRKQKNADIERLEDALHREIVGRAEADRKRRDATHEAQILRMKMAGDKELADSEKDLAMALLKHGDKQIQKLTRENEMLRERTGGAKYKKFLEERGESEYTGPMHDKVKHSDLKTVQHSKNRVAKRSYYDNAPQLIKSSMVFMTKYKAMGDTLMKTAKKIMTNPFSMTTAEFGLVKDSRDGTSLAGLREIKELTNDAGLSDDKGGYILAAAQYAKIENCLKAIRKISTDLSRAIDRVNMIIHKAIPMGKISELTDAEKKIQAEALHPKYEQMRRVISSFASEVRKFTEMGRSYVDSIDRILSKCTIEK